MPITYYFDSKFKKLTSPIESLQKKHTLLSVSDTVNLVTSGLDYSLWYAVNNWKSHEVLMHFSSTTNRDYSVNKIIGRGIIQNINDSLWIQTNGAPAQQIILSEGFYTGTTLSTELKNKLDTNQSFIDLGTSPFTVVYSNITGKFTITANGSEEIQYLLVNPAVSVNKNSTIAQPLGFNSNSVLSNSIVGDTIVAGLGDKIPIAAENGNDDTNLIVNLDNLSTNFDVDSALNLTISTADVIVDYKIIYEEYF